MINLEDILKLDDKKNYLVAGQAEFQTVKYYMLCDINDEKKFRVCYEEEENGESYVVDLKDKNILKRVLPLLALSVQKLAAKNIQEEEE